MSDEVHAASDFGDWRACEVTCTSTCTQNKIMELARNSARIYVHFPFAQTVQDRFYFCISNFEV